MIEKMSLILVILTKNLNVAYYNLKQILQDKHIPMDNGEHFLKKPVLHCSISAFLFSTYIPDVDMVKTGWMRSV